MKKTGMLITLISILVIGGFLVFLRPSDRMEGKVTGKLHVVVSMPLLKHLVSQIGGNAVTVTSIVKGASCNHEYEPTSQDLKQVAGSSLFIKVGMGFDRWVDELIRTVARPQLLVLDASQGIIPLQEEVEAEHDHEATEADHHHEGNPHYWGNPENVKTMAKNILNILIKILPEHKEQLIQNYTAYLRELDTVTAELKAKVAALTDKRIVSYSAAFPYFYQYFGFENLITVESTCEQEISPKRLAETARFIKEQRIQVLVGETVYPDLPENLVQETGTKLVLLWPGTNESEDYLATLRENVEKLVVALQ